MNTTHVKFAFEFLAHCHFEFLWCHTVAHIVACKKVAS